MANTLRSTFLITAALVVLLAFFTGTASAQTSAAPTTPAVTGAATNSTDMRYEVVLVYESISIWTTILMLTILVADACMSYNVVMHVASIGPLFNMLLAGAALTLAPLLGGNSKQGGFMVIMIQSSVVAVLSFFAAFAGFKSKKDTADPEKRLLPVGTISLLLTCGLMPAIAGTCISALSVAEGYQWPGIIMGSICIGLMTSIMIWYITRVSTKNRVAKVAETSNDVSMAAKY